MTYDLMENPKEAIEEITKRLLNEMKLLCCYIFSSSDVPGAAYLFHLTMGCKQSVGYYDIDVDYGESAAEESIRTALTSQHSIRKS